MVTKPETPVLKIEAEITQIRQSEYFHAWLCQLWHQDCLLPRSLLPDPDNFCLWNREMLIGQDF